jgi:hypothetical protein
VKNSMITTLLLSFAAFPCLIFHYSFPLCS